MVEVGDEAPIITMKITDKEIINIDFDLRDAYDLGSTVLYFFPAVFTGVCTRSSCELRDNLKDFESLGANIYSISVDLPFSHKKFIEEYEINYPILSDWNREAIESFGVVDNEFIPYNVAQRSLFIIVDRKIVFKWTGDNPDEYPPFDEIKDFLKNNSSE